MKNILVAKNLKKAYGTRSNTHNVLCDIDLNIKEGEFVGIMGPSGAGKTTLLNIISTIDKPTSGSITISGDNILNMDEEKLSVFRRERLGFIFQEFNLLDTLTAKENIILPLALSKMNLEYIENSVKELSQKLGLETILDKYPHEISGGQKQRVAAARAIINKPDLVLADEPTGSLDSKSATELLELLSKLNEKNKTTIVMVTHDAFAASYCKKIIFIKDGTLFTELTRGSSRKDFFNKILDVLKKLGSDFTDIE